MKLNKILFLLTLLLIPIIKVNAASFNVSASSKNVTVGSNVTIYINGSDVAGKVNISSSNTSVLSSSESSIWIEPNGSVTFSAKKTGSATITVTPVSLADNSGNDVNLSAKSITINVSEKKTYVASSNNSLKSLSIEGYDLNPAFDKGTTEYSVTVKEGTENINILATPEDNNSSVRGTGNIAVSSGLNNIEVVVTAENGYEKVYKLNVTVLDELITTQINNKDYSIVKQENVLPQVSSFYSPTTIEYKYKIEGDEKVFEIPVYYSDITNFTLVGLKDNEGNIGLYVYDADTNTFKDYKEINFSSIIIYSVTPKEIPDEFKEEKIIIGNQEVIAYRQNKKDDFYLIYGMNVNNGNTGWYQYDKKDNSIQRYDSKELDELKNINKKYLMTIYIISGISIMIIIFMVILSLKRKKSINY